MGHLSNPIGLRLGLNRFSSFLWSSNVGKSPLLTYQDVCIYSFVKFFFKRFINERNKYDSSFFAIFPHFRILRYFKNIFLNIFVYNFNFWSFALQLPSLFSESSLFSKYNRRFAKNFSFFDCCRFFFSMSHNFKSFRKLNSVFYLENFFFLFKKSRKFYIFSKNKFDFINFKFKNFFFISFFFKLHYAFSFAKVFHQTRFRYTRFDPKDKISKHGWNNIYKVFVNLGPKFQKRLSKPKKRGHRRTFKFNFLKLSSSFFFDNFWLFKKYRIKRFYFYLIKFLYSFVFKKFLYFVEKRFWNFLKVFLIFNLSKIVPLSSKIFINFHFWRRVRLDASFVSRYLQIRLFQGVPFRSLYYKILQTLSIFLYQKCILGFKISFKGRFSRRQRASFMWERVSSTPLNDKSSFVDFSYDFIILKYGACGLKVWLHLSDNYLLGVKSFHTVF